MSADHLEVAVCVAGVLIGSPGGQPPIEGRRSPECAPYGTLYAFLSQGVDVAIDDVPAMENLLEDHGAQVVYPLEDHVPTVEDVGTDHVPVMTNVATDHVLEMKDILAGDVAAKS